MSRADERHADALAGHLAHAMRCANASLFRPVWELAGDGPRDLLGYRVVHPSGPLPVLPSLEASVAVERSVEAISVFRAVGAKWAKLRIPWEDQQDKELLAAIRKWYGIIAGALEQFDLGRRYSRDDPLGRDLMRSLRHVFAGKSAGTLHNRANPLLRFMHWCDVAGIPAYPIDESTIYAFCCSVERSSSPSFLKSLRSSLVFAHHVLGLQRALDAADSPRVQGMTRSMFLEKRKRQPKPPLTQAMVRKLEELVCDEHGKDMDRYVAAVGGEPLQELDRSTSRGTPGPSGT